MNDVIKMKKEHLFSSVEEAKAFETFIEINFNGMPEAEQYPLAEAFVDGVHFGQSRELK